MLTRCGEDTICHSMADFFCPLPLNGEQVGWHYAKDQVVKKRAGKVEDRTCQQKACQVARNLFRVCRNGIYPVRNRLICNPSPCRFGSCCERLFEKMPTGTSALPGFSSKSNSLGLLFGG